MTSSHKLKKFRVAIVTHVFTTGPPQELETYLKDKVKNLVFIGHPFCYANDTRSFRKEYHRGKLDKESRAFDWRLPEVLTYVKDALYTLFWLLPGRERFALYVGADNLNAAMGVILKRLGRVEKTIFYTIDYVPYRFKNKIWNQLYHQLDRFCLKHCDYVWNLSPLMAEGREKQGLSKDKVAPQLTVPEGVHVNAIERLPVERINRHAMVFLGHLRENQGLELLIKVLPDIVARFPDTKLLIIGTGLLETHLKHMMEELDLEKHVTFTGYIESHAEIDKLMASCAIGMAPYEPNPNSFTYYADPAKSKRYLACGLPVIITKVPSIAEEIKKKKMGIVIDYDKTRLTEAIIKLFQDDSYYQECRANAIAFASQFDWDRIFTEVLGQCL